MNNLELREFQTSVSQSLFETKHPDVDADDKDAVNRAIWYMFNTRFCKDTLLRRSSKSFDVPMKRIDDYIRSTLGDDVFLKRNHIFDKSLLKKL